MNRVCKAALPAALLLLVPVASATNLASGSVDPTRVAGGSPLKVTFTLDGKAARVPPPPPTSLPTNTPLHSPPRPAASSALSLDESTIEEISFEPLTPSDLLCPGGQYNWYGKCVNVFRLFGNTSPKAYSVNLLTLSKVSHAAGVAIDKSVTPNRVYVADAGNNRILGWRSLGQCSVSHSACTFTSDCGGSGGTCDVDPLKPADLVIGTAARCNSDSNIGNLGLASANSLCLMPFPWDSNMAESSFSVPLTVSSSGDLLVTDLWNNRVLRFNDPFGTDTVADFVWGQIDFTGSKVNQGRWYGSPSDSSFSFYAPGRDAPGSPGVSLDASGNTWIADNQNGRVLRFPPGSKSADLVLGQGDLFSMSDQYCWTNSADSTVTPPLNIVCGPVMARVHPATGELWVLDNGYLGAYIGRILVFTPPFSNGMFASREIKPNIASLVNSYDGTTVYSPYWFKGWTFQWNEDLADYPNGVLWLNEGWQGAGGANRVLLLGATGDVLATIGSTGANMTANWIPGACGEIMRDYYSWTPSWIAVSGRNLLTSNNTPSTVSRYELPALNSTSDSTLCPPHAVGGLLDSSTFWSTPSPETMKGPIRVVAHAGQLAVGEEAKLKVWNDYLARPFGAAPDFELSTPGYSFAQFATDDNGYLWIAPAGGGSVIEAYRWPLTPSSTPAWSGVLHWADDGTPIANFSTEWSPHHVSFDPVHRWLWITDHNRLLRVSNYAAATASGGDLLVDMVIGQTSKGATSCNQGSDTPSAYTLCSGGKTAVDPSGNLFVVDVADAQIDLQAGNNRILGYRAADLVSASGLFPNVPAAVVFSDHGRFDEVSGFGSGPPAVIAFDGLGRMYLPNHCGFRLETMTHDGYCYWEMVVFASPLTKQTPDYYLRLPSGWSPGIGFDENNNLVWADTSASHVTVINPVTDPVWLTPMASYRFHIDQGYQPFSLQAGGPSYYMNLGIYADAGSPGSPVPVEFTLGPVPPGVSADWSTTTSCPDSPCWVQLVFTASPSAASGAYSLPIMATSTEGLRRYVVARFRVDGPLTCSGPAVAGVGQTIAFFAHGGTGATQFYGWSSDGTSESTMGATYDVSFPTEGAWTATVSFGDQSATCSVNVGSTSVAYTLTITKSGSGAGTVRSTPFGIDCGSDCSQPYPAGYAVTLSALPDAGAVFAGWSGDPDCSDGVVTMNAARSCTATFMLAPDLVISAFSAPSMGGAGAAISVSSTTKNQGSVAAPTSTTRFYLSTDAAWDAGDVLLGSRAIGTLAVGATSAGSTSLTIPAGTPSSNYFVIARADADSVIVETIETNNTASAAIAIGPDLIVSALSAPATGGAGLAISVSSTTKNQTGMSPAPGSTTKFYLSTDATWDAGDTFLDSWALGILAAGGVSTGSVSLTIPAGTASGNYFVIAKADADNLIFETVEANNTASDPIAIGPDLIVSALTAPAGAVAGSIISVTDTTTNQTGTSPAPASTTKYYLSTNTTWEAGDTSIGSRSVIALAAGASNASVNASVTIPGGTATGNYYVIAKADGDNLLFETNETNNTKYASIHIGPPDLVVSALSVPAKGGAGLPIVATNTTKNQLNTGPAPISTTKFYLSSNSTWDAGDTPFVATQPVGALAPGASEAHSTTLTIPATFTGVGTWYVIAKADADNQITETLETNNTAYDTIVIGPDLIVSALTVPAYGGAGLPITVTDTTKNQGAGSAAASFTRFYLSSNTTLGSGDVLLGSRSVGTLAPGATNPGSTTFTIPGNTAVGSYYVIAVADGPTTPTGSGSIAETVETNNTAYALIKLSPDLTVSVLTAPASAQAGHAFNVTDTTKNSGYGIAGPTTTKFYLSTNTTWDTGDTEIGSRPVGQLTSGATSAGPTSLTIPTSGTWYVLAKADAGAVVAEASETNNVMSKAITITP